MSAWEARLRIAIYIFNTRDLCQYILEASFAMLNILQFHFIHVVLFTF